MEHIIYTEGLTKTYKRVIKQEGVGGSIKNLFRHNYEEKVAVNSFDLQVEAGEFIGLIGPNGAGKTTLIKMLTGIIAPSSGKVEVLGFYPNALQNELKRQYAIVMGQKSQLFYELTTADMLRLFKELYSIPEKEYIKNRDYFIELFGVKELMNVQVRTLSLGERMKMELMTALLHNPKVLFLDEPTIGLDAIASKQIRGFLHEVNVERGTTIILTSHYMEDIKALCRRSVVINHGNKLFDGDTEELFEKYLRYKVATFCFDVPTRLQLPKDSEIIEQTEFKTVAKLPKEQANHLLEHVMRENKPIDVSLEEEEVGNIVERIYQMNENSEDRA